MAGITGSSLFPEQDRQAAEIRTHLRVFAGLFSANQKWIIYFWIVSVVGAKTLVAVCLHHDHARSLAFSV
jgi:hypothetical protein